MLPHLSSLAIVYLIPYLAISFVGMLVAYKLYIKIRSKFDITVNCWFCNQNTRVSYIEANSWTCPQCDQYNGFTKDGDYNRDLHQNVPSTEIKSRAQILDEHCDNSGLFPSPKNGFCDDCNERQRLKVDKLAQFEPKYELRFDQELKVYKAKLEEQYRLCSTCDRHLGKVLREKKKMVLGSKFLDYIIKGAELIKQPHFNQIRKAQKQKLKNIVVTLISVLTIINVICVFRTFPTLTMDYLAKFLGEPLGKYAFLGFSHMMALNKTVFSLMEFITNYQIVAKVILFFKTIMMMVLYSIGMKMQQITAITLPTLYIVGYPFTIFSLAFLHNIIDGFKLTRFTFLITLWSIFAGGLIDEQVILSKELLMILASFGTLWLSVTNKREILAKKYDTSTNSFHKMYSADYETDDDTRETISLLSQNLSTDSGNSIKSNSSCKTHRNQSSLRYRKPLTSSVMSLNQLNHTKHNSSFSYDEPRPLRSPYASSLNNFTVSHPMFASNLELNCLNRPRSVTHELNSSFTEPRKSIDSHQIANGSRNYGWNNIFESASSRNFSTANDENFANTPLASPFSVSSNNVYSQKSSNLLNPTRFSTTNLSYNDPSNSWLAVGGYRSFVLDQTHPKPNLSLESRNMTTYDEEGISRGSSQSSGFESAVSGFSICPPRNVSRENSVDLYPNADESFNTCRSFDSTLVRPDAGFNQSMFNSTIQPQNAYSLSAMQPLSVNCNKEYWKLPTPMRSNGFARDSFNLRKINDQLPQIRRGALLQKWKDSQTTKTIMQPNGY